MNKLVKVLLILILSSILIVNVSFALWGHDSEVSFRLTISEPEDDDECECGSYDTIAEGIQILKNCRYNKIYNKMDSFQNQLEDRITELNSLPFGGITLEELQEECNNYRNIDIAGFGECINKYGAAINDLADFYRNASQEEKDEVPDFWAQHTMLWNLHTQLWNKRQELYYWVNEVWEAGEAKIDYGNSGKGKGKGKD